MYTVALPATLEPLALTWATSAEIAASYWIGPSIRSSGRRSRAMRVASRTLSTSRPLPDSPVE